MKQRVVVKEQERCIYYIEEDKLSFYMIIPNSKMVTLIVELCSEVDDEMVKKILDCPGKVIVIPVVDKKIFSGIQEGQVVCFNYLDSFLAFLINTSYKILTFNHLEVEKKVVLNRHSCYETFNKWFIQKYGSRVELADLELNGGLSFVEKDEVKSVEEPLIAQDIPVRNSGVKESEDVSNLMDDENKTKDLGFVSYVLLGVLAAVISLVFLYLII